MSKQTIRKIKNGIIRAIQRMIQLIRGIDDTKIVCMSFEGKTYSDNPKALSEMLYRLDPKLSIVWIFNDPKSKKDIVPSNVTCVRNNSLTALYEMATAKVWIDNFQKPLWMYKSPKQIYVQTYHGDRGFKKVLFDSPFAKRNLQLLETDHCDYFMVGSSFAETIFSSAMKYQGTFIKKGTPRCDLLVNGNAEHAIAIKEQLGISSEVNIVLYAPTFRRSAVSKKEKQKLQGIDIERTLQRLHDASGNQWIMLVRAHSVAIGVEGIESISSAIDVSKFEDMADLLLVSDMLITDYSSCAGDFALLRRPCFLFQDDYEEYLKHDRSLYFEIAESPFLVAKNQDELESLISEYSKYDYEKNCEDILAFYGAYETGHASEEGGRLLLSRVNQ